MSTIKYCHKCNGTGISEEVYCDCTLGKYLYEWEHGDPSKELGNLDKDELLSIPIRPAPIPNPSIIKQLWYKLLNVFIRLSS
ncbi:unnamed protein product [marine sediment metagenome]|uniref:Uncharacterized protein n=1 Tax=marine sediment metagenome TaxID=412755 RepID=X0UV30_9ZZZZ